MVDGWSPPTDQPKQILCRKLSSHSRGTEASIAWAFAPFLAFVPYVGGEPPDSHGSETCWTTSLSALPAMFRAITRNSQTMPYVDGLNTELVCQVVSRGYQEPSWLRLRTSTE